MHIATCMLLQIAEHLKKMLIEKRITVISTADFVILEEKEYVDVWNAGQLDVLKVTNHIS